MPPPACPHEGGRFRPAPLRDLRTCTGGREPRGKGEKRKWTAPDGPAYLVRVEEQLVSDGAHTRRLRRIHFESVGGSVVGTAIVPGHLMLDLASNLGMYDLWRRTTGRLR